MIANRYCAIGRLVVIVGPPRFLLWTNPSPAGQVLGRDQRILYLYMRTILHYGEIKKRNKFFWPMDARFPFMCPS